jgi:dCTP deaminase
VNALEFRPDGHGVLPDSWIRKAIEAGVITADDEIPAAHVQPASLDLRLGDRAHRLRASFLPDREPVERKLREYSLGTVDLSEGAILEPNRPYLIPLAEQLDLPPGLRARANPKSSTGRLDVFTRLVTDRNYRFDDVPDGYSGRLYLELVSRTFTIRVTRGLCLNQLRLAVGDTRVSDAETPRERVLLTEGGSIPERRLTIQDGLYLSLDLEGDESGVVGYRARRSSSVIDLTLIHHYEPADFWEPVYREREAPRVVLMPEEFYLLLSAEAVRIEPQYAVEMSPYTASSGELRTHYAGFFDPGFGYDPLDVVRGSRAALEVRAHDVPFMVEQRQLVCRLSFERMLETPSLLYGRDLQSNYQGQRVTLSKHFRASPRTIDSQLSLLGLRGADDADAERR